MSDRPVIIASFITLTLQHALRMEPDSPPLLWRRDYGTTATKQQWRSRKASSNQLLQEWFREKTFTVETLSCLSSGACGAWRDLLLLTPLIFIAPDMKHLRLKARVWLPGTVGAERVFWAGVGNKKGGKAEIGKGQTQATSRPETGLHGSNCA